jgi:serine/threonine-protein kinase
MGIVMAAEHLQLRERVALKFLRVDDETGQSFRSRFRREAQICAKIKNEHITRVIDVGTYQDAEYMVMEHLDGSDLRGFIRGLKEPLTPQEAVELMVQVCDGLAEVHARGIVHRDLKPSNLFVVRRSDGTPLVKILDFGISKWGADLDVAEDELTKTGAVLGSPKYMAPEQLFGSHTVDARADVWSIGAIAYELLTGKPPFEEPTFARLCARLAASDPPRRAREMRPDLTEELDAAVMLCLERNLTDRIPNVAQLAGELLHAIGDATAETVRQRQLAILAGGTGSSELTTASVRSGEWVRASLSLSRTGANPSVGNFSISGTNPSANGAQVATIAPPADEKQSSKKSLYIALAVFALIAVFAIFRFSSPQGGDATAKTASTPSGTPSAAPTPTVAATPAVTTPSAAPTPTSAATLSTAEPSATTAPTHVATKPVLGKKPVGAAPAATPAPTPTVTAAPPPVVTTPPPEPKKPANPLEDRQ